MISDKPLVVVVGETASGKSAIGMEVARRFGGEIIAADSRTIYKGMDIGTAKPTRKDQAEIPHHLLDVVEPGEPYSVADFKTQANQAVADIRSRGKLPVMVGGTGLYVDAVVFDYNFSAKGDGANRRRLNDLSVDELQQLAAEQGIKTTAQILKNKRYLIRLIETGGRQSGDRDSMIDNVRIIGIRRSRNELRKRIVQRIEIMFKQGLRSEVDRLVQRYGWESESMTGICYREFKAYYEGVISMSQVKRDIAQDTLRLAKSQRTWFKRNPAIEWFDDPAAAVTAVADDMEQRAK